MGIRKVKNLKKKKERNTKKETLQAKNLDFQEKQEKGICLSWCKQTYRDGKWNPVTSYFIFSSVFMLMGWWENYIWDILWYGIFSDILHRPHPPPLPAWTLAPIEPRLSYDLSRWIFAIALRSVLMNDNFWLKKVIYIWRTEVEY